MPWLIFRSCIAQESTLQDRASQWLSCSCSFLRAQTCVALLIPYPGRARSRCAGPSVHPPLPCRRQGWQMWNIFLRLAFCAGALWEGWPLGGSEDSKRQKIFRMVPFNNENTLQLLFCSHMDGLPFSREKNIFQRGRINCCFSKKSFATSAVTNWQHYRAIYRSVAPDQDPQWKLMK